MKIYKKEWDGDVLVKCVDDDGDYSMASKNDPEPDAFSGPDAAGDAGWERISAIAAEKILKYEIFAGASLVESFVLSFDTYKDVIIEMSSNEVALLDDYLKNSEFYERNAGDYEKIYEDEKDALSDRF